MLSLWLHQGSATAPRALQDVLGGNRGCEEQDSSSGQVKPGAAWPISCAQPSTNSPRGKANLPLGAVYLFQGLLAFELELCTLLTRLLGSRVGPGSIPLAQMGLGSSPFGSEHEQSTLSFVPSPSHGVVGNSFAGCTKPGLGLGTKHRKRSEKQQQDSLNPSEVNSQGDSAVGEALKLYWK